jgi:hypothetical protein
MKEARISRNRTKFGGQIRVLDDLQLSDGIVSGTKKWQDFKWLIAESEYVTSVRTQSDTYMDLINSQRHCPPEIKDKMDILIDNFMDFDHDKNTGHRLLDKIALNGTIDDCEKLGIKRSTPLAKAPSHGGSEILAGKVRAALGVRFNIIGRHKITVRNEDTPDRRALPEGIARARVFRFIGRETPTRINQYESVGNAKRGLFEIDLTDIAPTPEKIYAWYIARYEDTRGNTGTASEPLKMEIYFPVG